MKQLASILIPAFNAEKWIGGCIESALAQTWPRKEIIVVNDGSRDSTLKIAKSYAAADIHVTTQENCGASVARNHALSLAQGDYIQWLDADDLLAPDKISIQMEGAEPGQSSNILLSGSWGKFYHRPENSKFVPDMLWEDLEPAEWLYRKLDGNLWMAIESWLVSRRLTELAGPWNEDLSLDDDGEYFCRVLSCASRIKFIPEARCFCRRATFGLSHDLTINTRKLESLEFSLFSHIRIMRTMEESQRTRDACLKLLDRWAIYFYPERPDLFKRMQSMARELGGQLKPPRLRPKYRWIQKIFGWRIAKKSQHVFPALRSVAEMNWERFRHLWSVEKVPLQSRS
jgi:glycosyltransferase involved in cell wall biosynthesis